MLILQDGPHGDKIEVVRLWQALVPRVVEPFPAEHRETALHRRAIDGRGGERCSQAEIRHLERRIATGGKRAA